MKNLFIALSIIFVIITGLNCSAQDNNKSLLRQVMQNNQEAVDAIAMYPTETRKIIFVATEYPEVIAKLNAMQNNSQESFEMLISSFSKEEQEKIWNLTRFDGLISDLVISNKKSEEEINNILANYPEEIRKTALEKFKKNYVLLVQIDNMNKCFNNDFNLLLNGYPPEAINSFKEMIKMPEVLNILFDHMQYTVVVGDYYKKNPERVLHKTDSLNLVLTQKNTQEANDWKQSLNDNPQVQEEYVQAAQEYAGDNGYQSEDYNTPLTPDVTNYNSNSFNWWFGFPSWYPYDYWNPYPYWYDWGFYYGPGRRIVFFGLPSAYFMDWYFYNPEHCSKYAELSNHYYNYYNSHRNSINYNSISHSVNDWRNGNKDVVKGDWDKDNPDRIQRFKEYGQMETDRKKYNIKNPQQQLGQSEYLQKKHNKYPLLSAEVSKEQVTMRDSKVQFNHDNIPEPVKKPTVAIPDHYKVEQHHANEVPLTRNPNSSNQSVNFNQIRNAQQYHQNTWKQIQPQSQPARQPQQNYNPPPRQQENHQVEQPVRQNTQAPSNNKRK